MAKAKEAGVYKESAKKGQATRANWTDEQREEDSRKRSEAKKKEWAANPRRNRHFGSRKRTSKHELALVPYMAALGYAHGTERRVGNRVPDFVDEVGKRVYEYFGTYWHPDPAAEPRTIAFYALWGWECSVLWESDLFAFLTEHKDLVTDEEHDHAWKIAHVNNGYKKPPV